VPVEVHALILDGLETLTIGAALMQASKSPETRQVLFASLDRETQPKLAEAVDANPWPDPEALFGQLLRSFLVGTVEALDRSGF